MRRVRLRRRAEYIDEVEEAPPNPRAVIGSNSGETGPPLTPDQDKARDLLNGDAGHICLVGGSRSGKTSLIVRNVLIRALKAEGSRHLITRFRSNALRASVWLDTYPKVLKMWFPGVKSVEHRQDGFEELPNGSQIWFGGLDEKERVEKILGQEYATIHANECSQIPYKSIMILRTRLAQSGTGLKLRAYYDLNPTTIRHWSNILFGEKKDPITKTALVDPENYVRAFLNPEGNAANLDPEYLQSLRNMPAQYRDRFYSGKYVVEIDGALWTADQLELCREDEVLSLDRLGRRAFLANFTRVVVAVDPSGAKDKDDARSDEIGIVVAGAKHRNEAAVFEDGTMRGSPKEWATRAVALYRKWDADLIVAEANFGGEMVRSTIQSIDPNVPVKLVHASRGKSVRAEPVSSLYDEGKVTHCGEFPEMEEELCMFSNSGYQGTKSPNRGDANVWALTELMLGEGKTYNLSNIR